MDNESELTSISQIETSFKRKCSTLHAQDKYWVSQKKFRFDWLTAWKQPTRSPDLTSIGFYYGDILNQEYIAVIRVLWFNWKKYIYPSRNGGYFLLLAFRNIFSFCLETVVWNWLKIKSEFCLYIFFFNFSTGMHQILLNNLTSVCLLSMKLLLFPSVFV